VTVSILHEVAGDNRVSAIDPETVNLLGQSAYLRGVGVGGDGTVYTLASPFTIANGKVLSHKRVGKSHDEITIRPHSAAFRATVPSGRLVGYNNALRFATTSDQAEITGYTSTPATFTLGSRVIMPRVWGSATSWTIAGNQSCRLYIKQTTGTGRQLHLDYEKAGPTIVTIDGPTFNAAEDVPAITARVDTAYASGTGVSVTFGIDGAFATATSTSGAFLDSSTAWKLGRWKTSTVDTADTIIGAWYLFDSALTDTETISFNSQRLTGDEDGLIWFFPGVSVGGLLLDYAAANASAPLDATITSAVAAPLLLGTPELAGVTMPAVIGYVQNAPATSIDPPRKIYRMAGEDVCYMPTVVDRQVPYEIEFSYDSLLDFADFPPTISGKVTVCPYGGGLFRVHKEVDGVENSADVLGHSVQDWAIAYGRERGVAYSTRPGFHPTAGGDFSFEISFLYGGDWLGFVFQSGDGLFTASDGFVHITSSVGSAASEGYGWFDVRIVTTGADLLIPMGILWKNSTYHVKVDAWEDGADVKGRVLVNGKVVASGTKSSVSLATTASNPTFSGTVSGVSFYRLIVGRAMMWNFVEATDALAEAAQREYMYTNPSPSETGLVALWYRHSGDVATLVDETSNGYDFTVSGDAIYLPGIAATDRLSAATYLLLNKSGTAVTYDETAYDYEPSAISYHIAGGATTQDPNQPSGISVASAAAAVLSGGGLYLLTDPDGSATIGQAQDPATATPTASVRVEFVNELDTAGYEFQPSLVEALYAPNPTVQSSVLAGADTDRRSFAERPYRSVEKPVGDNRARYADDAAPLGRRTILDTKFVNRSPAATEAARVAAQFDSPRPMRSFAIIGSDGADQGYTSYQPGNVLTIQNERLPGGSVNVLILSTSKNRTMDLFTVR
jgi:hypothetical protein